MSEAQVLFLGTGGAFSAGQRTNLALIVEQSDFRMLVECGPMLMHQLAAASLSAADVEHIFITHTHGDHALGFPMLVLGQLDTGIPLHIYTGNSSVSTLLKLWELAYPGFDPDRLNLHWHARSEGAIEVAEMVPGVTLHTGLVPHAPGVPTLAARWSFANGQSIAFATDTVPNPTTLELARDCDLLIHEASYSAVLQPGLDPAETFHSTARQAGVIAHRAGCRRLALVHLGPVTGAHPEIIAEEARADTDLEVIVPWDGERVTI
ncbi:MAG: MBL fold metallo-hydrolase [Anaerolineae bacterium]|nr:MBL fold metallo-hydrolase [Anaerolineae bacterium]